MCACSITLSCLCLCDPMDCSPPGSSVRGILQARMLEWVAIPFSRGPSPPRDWTHVSCVCLLHWQADSLPLSHPRSPRWATYIPWASRVAQQYRIRLSMQETQEMQARSLRWEDPLEKGLATHPSILAWRIPWTEEPGGWQSMRSQRSDVTEWLGTHSTCIPCVFQLQLGETGELTQVESVQFSSVAQSCPNLRPHEPQPATDAIQPSHPLSSPSPPALNLSQHQGLFQWVNSSHQVAKVLEFHFQHQSFQWRPRTDFL